MKTAGCFASYKGIESLQQWGVNSPAGLEAGFDPGAPTWTISGRAETSVLPDLASPEGLWAPAGRINPPRTPGVTSSHLYKLPSN